MPAEIGIVIGLLGASLVALVLVLIARREADTQRRQAQRDADTLREETRSLLAEAQRRDAHAAELERAATDRERAAAERERTAAEAERQAAEVARQAAERASAAERDAAERASAAERAAGERLAETERAAGERLAEVERTAAERLAEAEAAASELLTQARTAATAELESVAGLTADEAKAALLERIRAEAQHEAAGEIRRAEARAKRTAESRARQILAAAMQRPAAPTSAQSTLSVVALPSEEMKGRIIGKEGRNIRHFEALTGVNVLIDETPDTVVLSSFDTERREAAQIALEALIADGRIHPQRIESAYAEALAGAAERTEQAGHEAAERAGVGGLHPELVATLGRLRLRTSYGQNVLEHLVETAQVAAVLAAEVGADVAVTRRAAFLHDLGKALTAEQAGTHAALGAELAKRCGEHEDVVNAIAAHHDEVPPATVEAVLVQAADAISAARPGARREDVAQYLERMDRLEHLVAEHPGVRRALAMSAGREVRVVVEPEEVADADLPGLAEAIARHIEADLSYPGEIRVTVVRELRASATAG